MSELELLLYIAILAPFAMFGLYKLLVWVFEMYKVKKGHFKVTFRMPNHRKFSKFIKPEKDNLKQGEKTFPFSAATGFVAYSGNTPEIEYDKDEHQINFDDIKNTSIIDAKGLSALGKRAYNLGKIEAQKNDKIMMFLMFAVVGATLISAGISFLVWQDVGSTLKIAQTLLAKTGVGG